MFHPGKFPGGYDMPHFPPFMVRHGGYRPNAKAAPAKGTTAHWKFGQPGPAAKPTMRYLTREAYRKARQSEKQSARFISGYRIGQIIGLVYLAMFIIPIRVVCLTARAYRDLYRRARRQP